MPKCLYTEADITQTGSQIILNAVNLDGEVISDKEKEFKHAWPEAWKAMESMLKSDLQDNENVRVGDVIWTQQGGNRHLGFCVVKQHSSDDINKMAVSLCMKSARKKAKELGIEYVGMGLFGSNNGKEWANIVEIVEADLDNIQAVVCLPTNEELVDVLENLPGSNHFKMIKSN